MALKLAKVLSECSRHDDFFDVNDLIGNTAPAGTLSPIDLMMRPDFGFEFVSKVSDPKYLSVLSHPQLRWLKVAACMTRSAVPDKWKQPSQAERDAVAWAVALALNPASVAHAEIITACLICRSSTPCEVADLLGVDADHIAAFHDLFFNVTARRNEKVYIHLIAHPVRGTSLPFPMIAGGCARPLLALAMGCRNLGMFCELLDWERPAESTASLRETSNSVLQDLIRRVPALIPAMSGDYRFWGKLPQLVIQAARRVSTDNRNDDASGYGGGDYGFSIFAESLLHLDVEELQEKIRQKMAEQRSSP